MQTLYKVAENPTGWDSYDNYLGETPSKDWAVLLGRNRDSDVLTESNWQAALELLVGESETVNIHRFGHWACGWLEYLCVRIMSPAHLIAQKIESDLENYPVLDEEDYCEREQGAAESVWADCYNPKERIEYIRENPDQFDFNSFADVLGCVRGQYHCWMDATKLLY